MNTSSLFDYSIKDAKNDITHISISNSISDIKFKQKNTHTVLTKYCDALKELEMKQQSTEDKLNFLIETTVGIRNEIVDIKTILKQTNLFIFGGMFALIATIAGGIIVLAVSQLL